MFAWLVVPLLSALKWLFGFVGNYGWSIIALTVILNLAMFPLRHKSCRRDEEDADGPAADAGDSEALLASEDDRPGAGRR